VVVCDGFGQEKTSVQEKLAIYDWLKAQYQEDHGYFDSEYDSWMRVRGDLIDQGRKVISSSSQWSKEELRVEYARLMTLALDSIRWGVMIECADPYGESVLPLQLARAFPDLSAEDCNNIIVTLSAPLIVSFMEEFELEKLQILADYREALTKAANWEDLSNEDVLSRINEVAKSYQWLTVNYAGSPPLSSADVFKQLKDDAAVRNHDDILQAIEEVHSKVDRTQAAQVKLLAQYDFPEDILDDFSILREIGRWMDERKESMVRTNLALFKVLAEISKVSGISKNELEWYTVKEIDNLLESDNRVSSQDIINRSTKAVFVTEYDGEGGSYLEIYTGDRASELSELLNSDSDEPLTGMVAARGHDEQESFSGTVEVVLDAAVDNFTLGNILVTSMTRPDFVPLLKKASAIITDEGGVTCHAAVVSRELGIPCIIGTRHSTKRLRSGDKVTLNLQTGVIERL